MQESYIKLLAYKFPLETITGLLTDAGDLASAFGANLSDVTSVFGRLKSGDFGEAFERLRDFGISRKDLEGEGLQFDGSGSFKGSAEVALATVRKLIRQTFGGSMKEASMGLMAYGQPCRVSSPLCSATLAPHLSRR